MKKSRITGIILAKNEEKNIKRSLQSISWCEQIIVVDDFSEDRTVAIAKKLGAIVYKRRLNDNFSSQRNFALKKVSTDWVLFVDADEVVSSELAQEMQIKTKRLSEQGFFIVRKDHWLGKAMNHGEFGQTRLLRLARKGSGKWGRAVHETWRVEGAVGELVNPLDHYPHPSLSSFLTHINFHSSIHAKANKSEHKNSSVFKIFMYPTGKFLYNFVLRRGFMDGMHGFVAAFIMSFHSFLAWSKLWIYTKG